MLHTRQVECQSMLNAFNTGPRIGCVHAEQDIIYFIQLRIPTQNNVLLSGNALYVTKKEKRTDLF
jgi:hypothetical protein